MGIYIEDYFIECIDNALYKNKLGTKQLNEYQDYLDNAKPLLPDMQTELENLKQLKPFEDIESFHNYLDTSIYFINNSEIYNQYCEQELKTFTENTGFEITG